MKIKIPLLLLFLALTIIVGCKAPEQIELPPIEKPAYDTPLPPGQNALRKIINPSEIPDFTIACLNLDELKPAVERSLNYLSKPSSKEFFPISGITHDLAVESLKAYSDLLDSGMSPEQLNVAIRDKFDVYISVGCDNRGTVLFTGYYTPILDGSFEPGGRFKYPLYTLPEDLVKDSYGEVLGRRGVDGTIRPYPSRAIIEKTNMLKGKELVWLSDPFEAYIAHVQGSAKIKLPDGQLTTVGYAAHNGHEYQSVAKALVSENRISSSEMNLTTLINYFKARPDEVSKYTQKNPRFVFFRKEDGEPRGSLNEVVTSMRTIATDKSIFPRGSLVFISTVLPQVEGYRVVNKSYQGFVLDQDTGGAIRAPGRCDVYMGQGELAGRLAGRTYQEGKLYYLFLK